MKKRERMWNFSALTAAMCMVLVLMTGCGGNQETKTDVKEAEDLSIRGKTEIHYTQRDLSGTYDKGKRIHLKESYTIEKEGTYIFSGSLDHGQIIVDADDQAKVQIVLNGLELHCKDGPAIYVKSADKVFLTLAEETENTISDGKKHTSVEDEPWGAVFSKDDLTINGSGALIVEGNYMHGIVSKDSLKITSGNIHVTAKEDGIRGKDEICIHDGNITIAAGEDGMKSNNDEEEGLGNISIDGGNVEINGTESQGIDGYHVVQILGGNVSIDTENEGIQGEKIYIAGGSVIIDAVDDCLNAKDSAIENSEEVHNDAVLEIADGKLTLYTSAGDGLDSNGHIVVSGGKTVVYGASNGVEVAMDYNGTAAITGGTVLATGTHGMAQNFDESSTQCSLMYNCSGSVGSNISLKNSEGKEIISYEAKKDFSSIIISSPDLVVGETYTLHVGDSEMSVTLNKTITNQSGGMSGDGFGGPGGPPEGPDGIPGHMEPM